jgi:hypothetical protein
MRLNKLSESDFYNKIKIHKDELNQSPSFLDRTLSLAKSVADWKKSGFSTATAEKLADRLDICKGCEFWDGEAFAGTGKCKKCGCSTQAKLRMATSKCPIDKWGTVDVETHH